MPTPDFTLEQFRAATADRRPTPAGVAVAATSASLAFALLAKVLRVSARRKDWPAHSAAPEPLIATAQGESQRMMQLAGEDMAAVEAYMRTQRLPHSTPEERQRRQQAIDTAVRQAIDLPLEAARAASAGVQLSGEVLALAPLALIADIGAVASLLSGAVRTFVLCAESNVRLLAPDELSQRDALASATEHSRQALRQADQLLERVTAIVRAGERPDGAR